VGHIDVSVEKRVAELTLNRPEKLNAMNAAMQNELMDTLEELQADRAVSCVLLRGTGRAFSVGYDLNDIDEAREHNGPVEDWARLVANTQRWINVWDFPKPIVSAVHGHCLAGAAFMVAMTDIVVVADDLVVAWARVPLGGGWLTPVFTHLVGARKAYELSTIRGSEMTGREAADLGWANYSLPADQVLSKARALASQVARVPVDLLILNKKAKKAAMERMGFRDAITSGIETNVIAHFSPGGTYVRNKLHELGIKGVIEWFEAGGTLEVDFDDA
jgi:enoyl-CoA hydratase/carnithine racemase